MIRHIDPLLFMPVALVHANIKIVSTPDVLSSSLPHLNFNFTGYWIVRVPFPSILIRRFIQFCLAHFRLFWTLRLHFSF